MFADLTAKIAQGLLDQPLQQVSFDPDSAMTRWTAILTHFAVTGQAATDLRTPPSTRCRRSRKSSSTNTASTRRRPGCAARRSSRFSLGWRVFEDYLVTWGKLKTIKRQTLHDEVTSTARRIGAVMELLALESDLEAAVGPQAQVMHAYPEAASAVERFHAMIKQQRDALRSYLEGRGESADPTASMVRGTSRR